MLLEEGEELGQKRQLPMMLLPTVSLEPLTVRAFLETAYCEVGLQDLTVSPKMPPLKPTTPRPAIRGQGRGQRGSLDMARSLLVGGTSKRS